ncbi:MAG: alpha/beta fold hydrolase, partial [Chromatiales bacterium]|nr:alpha/beta fold hydrolase [Chromatiales bacterium]
VVDVLRSRYPDRNILCLGFSLGGNVLLKWLGEQGANAPVKAALTVSVPFDLACAANALNSGFARVYQWYLVRSLVAHLRRKFAGQTAPVDIDSVTPLSSFWHFDNQITAPLHGFADVQDYYARCSSNQFLTEIRVPTLLVQAKDDPFLPADCIPNTTQMSPCVSVEATDEGGHVGFVGRSPTTGALHYWLEERVVEHFEQWA